MKFKYFSSSQCSSSPSRFFFFFLSSSPSLAFFPVPLLLLLLLLLLLFLSFSPSPYPSSSLFLRHPEAHPLNPQPPQCPPLPMAIPLFGRSAALLPRAASPWPPIAGHPPSATHYHRPLSPPYPLPSIPPPTPDTHIFLHPLLSFPVSRYCELHLFISNHHDHQNPNRSHRNSSMLPLISIELPPPPSPLFECRLDTLSVPPHEPLPVNHRPSVLIARTFPPPPSSSSPNRPIRHLLPCSSHPSSVCCPCHRPHPCRSCPSSHQHLHPNDVLLYDCHRASLVTFPAFPPCMVMKAVNLLLPH